MRRIEGMTVELTEEDLGLLIRALDTQTHKDIEPLAWSPATIEREKILSERELMRMLEKLQREVRQ